MSVTTEVVIREEDLLTRLIILESRLDRLCDRLVVKKEYKQLEGVLRAITNLEDEFTEILEYYRRLEDK